MARKPLKMMAKPAANSLAREDTRQDVVKEAVKEAEGERGTKRGRPITRPRKDLVSANIWMSPDARKQLKIFCLTRDETMEAYILRALNAQLKADKAGFDC